MRQKSVQTLVTMRQKSVQTEKALGKEKAKRSVITILLNGCNNL